MNEYNPTGYTIYYSFSLAGLSANTHNNNIMLLLPTMHYSSDIYILSRIRVSIPAKRRSPFILFLLFQSSLSKSPLSIHYSFIISSRPFLVSKNKQKQTNKDQMSVTVWLNSIPKPITSKPKCTKLYNTCLFCFLALLTYLLTYLEAALACKSEFRTSSPKVREVGTKVVRQ